MTEDRDDPVPQTYRENELRFPREQGFFDRSLSIRLLIGFIFALSLFIFLHFREVRVEVLELNTLAPRYVVAQDDFEFVDEEDTNNIRQEAIREIGKIYKFYEKEIVQARTEVESDWLHNDESRRLAGNGTLEQLYKGLDAAQKALIQVRFTDPRTLQRMRDTGLSTLDYEIYTPSDSTQAVSIPKHVWLNFQKRYLPENQYPQALSMYIINTLRARMWHLDEDIPAIRTLRKNVQSYVKDRITTVNAGNRIIDQGEKVTARHIAMLQAMKKSLNDKRNLWYPSTLAGSLLLTLILTIVGAGYLQYSYPSILASNRRLFLLVTIIVLTMFISKLIEYFLLTAKSNLIELVRYPLFVPFAGILICNLLNSGIAVVTSLFLTIVFAVALAFDHAGFMLENTVSAIVAIISTHSLRRRKDIFAVCGKAWLACVVVIFGIHLYDNTMWGFSIFADLLSSFIFMAVTAVLVLGSLPLLESSFHIMSDATMMEYMDPNHELLRRLSFEAPGTYQHTLVVCNIAEAAATAIGANGLFCRASCLYHDIGKMTTPHYFTENQQGGVDVHQLLTPQESAQVIMAHVGEGVALARKAGLPEQFIDVIKEHHGTQLVYYFYRKALDLVGGDKSKVNEFEFRYSGPKPRSKEAALIMIADSFEAASRSLDKFDEQNLQDLIDRLIREKAEDGQFDECPLTFEELGIAKRTMVKILFAAMHSRVKYPKRPERTNVPTIDS
jgi:putative nucleotidyltransferase with HDIG domain